MYNLQYVFFIWRQTETLISGKYCMADYSVMVSCAASGLADKQPCIMRYEKPFVIGVASTP